LNGWRLRANKYKNEGETEVMTYRVIQIATGRLGSKMVSGIVDHPDLELVGAWVHSKEKEGRDLGELCGLNALGVIATRDIDALLAMQADCVCYTAARTWTLDPKPTLEELARILRSGKNVVNATWPALVYPPGVSDAVYNQLQEACLEGGTSLYTTGIDPGYGSVGLAMAALNVCAEVRSVLTQEIGNMSNWVDDVALYSWGQPDPKKCLLLKPGFNASVFRSTVVQMAEAMGVQLDDVVEGHDVLYAEEAFEAGLYSIPAGTIAGMRFQVKGMIDGVPRVVLEHVAKLRDTDFPDVHFKGNGYRVTIDGEPCIQLDFRMTLRNPATLLARPGYTATAMALVNAIPQVCNAPPGVLSYTDLRPHPSKNFQTGRR
jgi:2,4-diaminopentanoate dehydrogenase